MSNVYKERMYCDNQASTCTKQKDIEYIYIKNSMDSLEEKHPTGQRLDRFVSTDAVFISIPLMCEQKVLVIYF